VDVVTVLGAVMLALFGVFFTVAGVWWLVHLRGMRGAATGTVIGMTLGPDADTVPIVRFTTAQGRTEEFVGRGSVGRILGPRVGDSIAVRYAVDQPSTARIATFRGSYVGPVLALALGIAALGLLAYSVLYEAVPSAGAGGNPARHPAAYLHLERSTATLGACAGVCAADEFRLAVHAYAADKSAVLASRTTSAAVRSAIHAVSSALPAVRRHAPQSGRVLKHAARRLIARLDSELMAGWCGSACARAGVH
jgi:hypothetical protein